MALQGYAMPLCIKMNYVTCLSVTFPLVTCLALSTTTLLFTRVLTMSFILTTSNNSGERETLFIMLFLHLFTISDDVEEHNDDVLEITRSNKWSDKFLTLLVSFVLFSLSYRTSLHILKTENYYISLFRKQCRICSYVMCMNSDLSNFMPILLQYLFLKHDYKWQYNDDDKLIRGRRGRGTAGIYL